jgi:hypothetical protein
MSNVEFIDIECRKKGHSIILIATAPDGITQSLTFDCDDIRSLYHCSCEAFMDKYADDEATLRELFNSVHGISANTDSL